MSTATKSLPEHGSLSRHKYHGCKCATCYEGYRTYQRTRHRRRGYGTWQPYVDAEPVRQHLLALNAAGLSYAVIAEQIGRHTATVTGFIYDIGTRPRKKRATPEVAAKILAIRADDVMPGMVDATGTGRRLQALAAIGWPMRTLGPYIGIAAASVTRLAGQQYVFRDTAQAVAATFEHLQHERPEDHGVRPGTAIKTRNWAARNQWPDPLWWDDMGHIDDPAFNPAKAEKVNSRSLAALRRTEIQHLHFCGISDNEIALRLGLTAPYVADRIRAIQQMEAAA